MRRVFTNGCFDLLHIGHIKLLQYAKSLGDELIVGLNTDESVKRLKGAKRPIHNEKTRKEMLLALRCVDNVYLFDEDTPLELITLLRPDVIVKGKGYTPEAIVGYQIAKSVVAYDAGIDISTGQIIERICNLELGL